MTDQTGQSAKAAASRAGDPALQQLDPRTLRDVHHGRTGAMWAAVVTIMIAFVIGGAGMVLLNWVLLIIGAGVAIAGIVIGLVLRALGYGLYQQTER